MAEVTKNITNQHDEIKTICNSENCGAVQTTPTKVYYRVGGARCSKCKVGTLRAAMNTSKRQTHKNSRDRKPRGGQKG